MYLTSNEAVSNFQRDGFLLVENLFSKQEVEKMLEEVEHGNRVAETMEDMKDAQGKTAELAYWEDLADDIWSAVSTCPRIVNNIRLLLGEEAAFYHGKVMLKKSHTGGAWEWHQDYGYWYDLGLYSPI